MQLAHLGSQPSCTLRPFDVTLEAYKLHQRSLLAAPRPLRACLPCDTPLMVGTRGKRAREAAEAPAAEPEAGRSKRRRSAAAAEQKKAPVSKPKPKPAAKAKPKPAKPKPAKKGAGAAAAGGTVTVNRAPVLTLWVAVVAQRQGYR